MENLTRVEAHNIYKDAIDKAKETNTLNATLRYLAKTDLFFLLVYICKREDVDRDWLFDRCREVQANPDGYLDLWARFHYKSTIGTFGLTIQEILNNPNITICILSFNRPTAKTFLSQIKRELESNKLLNELFPEILWENPNKSTAWSLDTGLIVQRGTNPKESTVEAHGLVDSQPTGRHYNLLIYDDTVTKESVSTPDMIKKTTGAWELSRALGTEGGKSRYYGTRYHHNDTYKVMMDRHAVIPRIHTATDTGATDGKSVLIDQEELDIHRREMGPYTFASQMLQDPKADNAMGFRQEWLRHWDNNNWSNLNKYIIVDPANAKKKKSDYTAMLVIGYGNDNNYYIIDMVRDRLNLTEKTDTLMALHRKYRPLQVYYEKYGMQTDIQHIQYVMEHENYRFHIQEVGGPAGKEDRIMSLVPLFEQGRIYLPHLLYKKNYEGIFVDVIEEFTRDEYLSFPVSAHDDVLDAMARINDEEVKIVSPQIPVHYEPYQAETGIQMARR